MTNLDYLVEQSGLSEGRLLGLLQYVPFAIHHLLALLIILAKDNYTVLHHREEQLCGQMNENSGEKEQNKSGGPTQTSVLSAHSRRCT